MPRRHPWDEALSANRLLATLAASDAARLRPNSEEIALEQGHVLFQVDEPLSHVYFPHVGVVSLQVLGTDGAVVEAASIGNEGVIGLGGLLAGDVSFTRQIVQLPGRASKIPRANFVAAINKSAVLRGLLYSHADAFSAHVLQTSACNAKHSTEERMARWLLMAFDRCNSDHINLTHDDLAVAFGVNRPTVTLIVRSLQAAHILEATRRSITVVDRSGLEQITCECYLAIRRNYERVFDRRAR